MRTALAQKSAFSFLFPLLFIFLFVFPKGGIKINDIPITWGYLLLAVTALLSFFSSPKKLHYPQLMALICMIPFMLVFLSCLLFYGFEDLSLFLSFLTSMVIFPIVFFITLSDAIYRVEMERFFSFLKKGMLFVASFGIFLFVFRIFSDHFFTIPYLTINAADSGLLETEKCIDRGGFFKLISTYNNGNLYGICLLLFLPLYNLVEKSALKKIIVKTSFIFTLSRTVWIGLFFAELIYLVTMKLSPHEKRKHIFTYFFLLVLTFLTVEYFPFQQSFLLDQNLGGRADQLNVFSNLTYFPTKPFFQIEEMVYLSMLDQFGIVGLICFLIAMIGPIFTAIFLRKSRLQKNHIAIALGLITYLFISISDGAIMLIPTMCFYLFLASLMHRDFCTDL